MRILLQKIFVFQMLVATHAAFAQGWVAEVDIDLNHDLYALEKISSAVLNFSGVTVNGSSATSQLHFTISGNDPMSGSISLSVKGLGWEPYDRGNPYSESLSASFTGVYRLPCQTGFFEKEGESPQEQIYIWIKIYPRLEITSFVQQCDKITLTSLTCSPRYSWEVSDNATGGFKTLAGKSTASVIVTREELVALGFTNPYGRKYFRVTGVNKTTSQLQPIEVYYPGPTITFLPTPPKCHDGNDGSVAIDITTSVTAINDFVVTLFLVGQSTLLPSKQEVLMDASTLTFQTLIPGSYLIRVENSTSINTYGNCWSDISFELENPDVISISSATLSDFNGYPIRCNGGQDGRIEVKASGGTGVYPSFQWTPSISTTGIAANLPEGVYEVKARDTNDCWSQPVSYRLTAPKAISVNLMSGGGANGFGVSCHDKADGSVSTDVTGGVPAYRYAWADGSTKPLRNGLTTGSYALTVTDGNGCAANKQITLIAPAPIAFSIKETSGITCAGAHSGALEVQSINNAIGNIRYRWNTGEQYQSIVDKPAGTYTVVITDDQGCTAARSHVLENAPSYSVAIRPTSDFHGSPIKCYGDNSGILTTVVTDDKGKPASVESYTWYKDGTEMVSGLTASTVAGLGAGIYRAEIHYRSQCRAESTFILVEPDPVKVMLSTTSNYHGADISCAGKQDGAILASASGGKGGYYTYLWNNGQTSPALTNIGAGQYAVVVKDINGCSSSSERIVSAPMPLTGKIDVVSAYNDMPISCTNAKDARMQGSAKGGTGPFSYQWSSGPTTSLLSAIGAGHYTLTIRDVNGCTTSVDQTLVDPDPVLVTLTDSSHYNGFGVSCNGSRDGYLIASATGGTGIYSYRWNDQVNATPRYENLRAGNYSVTVSDQNGCRHSLTKTITEPAEVSLRVSKVTAVSCHNGSDGSISLEASGGTGEYTFSRDGLLWQDDPVKSGLMSGLYELLIKDSNGCQQSTTAFVPQPSAITIAFEDVTAALCGDPRGAVTSTVTGGTSPYSLEWRSSKETFMANTSRITGLASGVYTLLVTDQNRCSAVRPVAIPSADGPQAEVVDINPTTCSYTQDGSASINITEGFGPFAITWPNGDHTPAVSNLAKGEYIVEIKDVNNCMAAKPFIIQGPDSLLIDIVETIEPTCHNSCDGKISVAANGGNGGNTFRWNSATGPVLDQLCAGIYTVTVSDNKKCEALRTIALAQPENINVDLLSLRSPGCYGDCDGVLEIGAWGGTGDLQVEWSNGNSGAAIFSLCAGTYVATITDMNQCAINASYTLTEPPVRSIDVGESAVICAGQSYTLDGGPSWITFLWTSSTGFSSSSRSVTISNAGSYWLEAFDENNCSARDTFQLETSTDLLKSEFLMTSEVSAGDTLVIIDISWPLPESVSWTFPEEMQLINQLGDIVYGQFSQGGLYEVTLTATAGDCRDALTKQIVVLDVEKVGSEEGRLGYTSFVKAFSLYPNPNDGMFDVDIELQEEAPVILTIWNALTSRMVAQVEEAGSKRYLKHIDLRPLSAGPYTLRLDYGVGTKFIRFIVR